MILRMTLDEAWNHKILINKISRVRFWTRIKLLRGTDSPGLEDT